MTARKINSAIHPPSVGFGDIEELCKLDPTVYACMGYYFRGEISKEKALITCILVLAAANNELREQLVKELESKPASWVWSTEQTDNPTTKGQSLDGPRPKTGTGD